jgi:dTDP-4-amino-4,6-dideoxygalactose transaminase
VVPFNRPTIAPSQIENVVAAFRSNHLSGDGEFTRRVSTALSEIHGGSRVLLTTSCTAALEISALLLDIREGDEVIVPSFTFVSSANAFVLMGARIVFVDIDPETFNLDERQVEQLLTSRTRAVVAVNYGGIGAVSSSLVDLLSNRGVRIIEDNAHGLFGKFDGKPLGVQSDVSTLSFHETKNVTCGEGGALILNEPTLIERAEILREKGTNRSRFFQGLVDKYTWIDVGSSYLLSDVNAAILLSQLDFADEIQRRRANAVGVYREALRDWAMQNGIEFQAAHPSSESPNHLFALLLPDATQRTRFLAHMRAGGVGATFHYVPLDTSPAGRRFGTAPMGCPVANEISSRLIRLPLYSDIKVEEVHYVIKIAEKFSCQ